MSGEGYRLIQSGQTITVLSSDCPPTPITGLSELTLSLKTDILTVQIAPPLTEGGMPTESP